MIKEWVFIETKDIFEKDFYKASVLLVSDAVYSHNAMRQLCREMVKNHCSELTIIGGQHEVWHLICDEVCAFDYDNDDEHYVMTSSYEDLNPQNIESWFVRTPFERAVIITDEEKIRSKVNELILKTYIYDAIDMKLECPEENVLCPICNNELEYKESIWGTSKQVKCKTKGCINDAVRGI